ncbi:MAG: AAA domain-containing protein [Gammaproteobacteria bacterium]|nr:AAA domain-containing protein [Gammaproteobacteria bacterium]
MPWTKQTLAVIKRVNVVKHTLKDYFIERDTAIDLLILATVCHEHLLLIGSPGTAKTQLVANFTRMIDARCFHYLLTRFTEPSELFGPLDLEKFQQGTYHIRTDGMLPEAQVVFLDEVFQGSSAILNTLLTLVNERVFHNGSVHQHSPLMTVVGASNLLPDDPWLQAFADRFALRLHIDPVPEESLDDLITQGWELELQGIENERLAEKGQTIRVASSVKIKLFLDLYNRLAEVDISQLRPVYASVIRELRAEGIDISDRRVIKGLKLIAGAALMRESDKAEVQDLWPLNYFWGRPEEAETAKGVVQPKVEDAGGPVLARVREALDIMEDIEVLVQQEANVRTEVALGAHLMTLNRLRREILKDHRGDQSLRKRVEDVIQHNLARLEKMDRV